MRRFLEIAETLLRWLCVASLATAAIFIAVIAVVGAADVVGTSTMRMPFPGALEITELSLLIVVFMGLAQAQRQGAHITVDIFSARFTGKAKWLSQALALLSAMVFFGFIAVLSSESALQSVRIDERALGAWPIPIWPGRIMLALGAAVAGLEALRGFLQLCLGAQVEPSHKSPEELL